MTAKIFHTVYEIWNPLTLECIYVGKGNTKRCRFPDHIRDAKRFMEGRSVTNAFKAAVISKILKMGAEPVFIEIGRFETEEESLVEEKRLIEHYGRRIDGGTLTNLSLGGQGNYGFVMPEEHSRKKSDRMRGKKMSEEAKEKMRKAATGRAHTEETKKKLREFMKTRPVSIEGNKRGAEKRRGKKMPEGHGAKVSAALKGRDVSGWINKIADARRGKPWSEAMRKAMEERKIKGLTRKKRSPDKKKREVKMKSYDDLTPEQKKNRDKYLRALKRKSQHVVSDNTGDHN